MALDPRSMERLSALGRTLPKKLPPPEPSLSAVEGKSPLIARGTGSQIPSARPSNPVGNTLNGPRHPVEQAQDPEDLFRALISASPDGTVPPHLLDRLRQLESNRLSSAEAAIQSWSTHASGSTRTPQVGPSPRLGKGAQRPAPGRSRQGKAQGTNEDQTLYAAFAQLLLEDDAGA